MKFHSIECLAITSIMISIKRYTKPNNLNSAPKWTETIRKDWRVLLECLYLGKICLTLETEALYMSCKHGKIKL